MEVRARVGGYNWAITESNQGALCNAAKFKLQNPNCDQLGYKHFVVEIVAFHLKYDYLNYDFPNCDYLGYKNFVPQIVTIPKLHLDIVTFRSKCEDLDYAKFVPQIVAICSGSCFSDRHNSLRRGLILGCFVICFGSGGYAAAARGCHLTLAIPRTAFLGTAPCHAVAFTGAAAAACTF